MTMSGQEVETETIGTDGHAMTHATRDGTAVIIATARDGMIAATTVVEADLRDPARIPEIHGDHPEPRPPHGHRHHRRTGRNDRRR